jgi:hypothetical protein
MLCNAPVPGQTGAPEDSSFLSCEEIDVGVAGFERAAPLLPFCLFLRGVEGIGELLSAYEEFGGECCCGEIDSHPKFAASQIWAEAKQNSRVLEKPLYTLVTLQTDGSPMC